MATLEELVVKLSAETGQLQSELKAATAAMTKASEKMSDSVSDLAKTTEKSSSLMQRAFATAAGFIGSQAVIGAFNMAKDAAAALFETFVVDGVRASSETQVALNNLVQAMSRAGNAGRGTASDMEEFASGLQQVSAFGDDAILNAAALLENLTRLDSQGLKKVTPAVMDFAAALGMDLNTAASLVGKALEGNVGALARYGIKVEEGTTKTDTYNNVMKALGRFSGAAAGQLDTLAGAQARAMNNFSDFTKLIGDGITKNTAFVAVFNEISKVLGGFTKDGQSSARTIRTLFAEMLTGAIRVAEGVVSAFGAIMPVGIALTNVFLGLGGAVTQIGRAIDAVSAGKFSEANAIMNEDLAKFTISLNTGEEAVKKLQGALGQIGDAAQVGLAQTRAGAEAVIEPTDQAAAALMKLKEEQAAAQEAERLRLAAQLENSQAQLGLYESELELLETQYAAKLVSEEAYQAKRLALQQSINEQELLVLNQGLAQKKASEDQADAVREALKNKQVAEDIKREDEAKKRRQKEVDERIAQTSQMFGNFAQLSKTGNKELGAIAKAAAIAQATIDTYAGATKAFGQGGFFGGFAMAASVVAAGMANIAKISATPLQSGITSVPGIGSSDNFPAMLAPGERVVPSETNQDLTNFLANGGGGGPKTVVNVSIQMNDVFSSDPREMGMRLADVLSEAFQANGVQLLGSKIA